MRIPTIQRLFEEQVERTPNTLAVVFEVANLTYQELNNRANQLAHYLQSRGVGPETLVGICMERSLDLPIGILGILKSGGTCVPLDPDDPIERLWLTLDNSRVRFVVTQHNFV